MARAGLTDNMSPAGIGKVPDSAPPAGLDWDMWLGPSPSGRSTSMSCRTSSAGGRIIPRRWPTGVRIISTRCAGLPRDRTLVDLCNGGIYAVDDCRTNPDTAEVIFEHASGMLTMFSTFEASGRPLLHAGEIEMRGTLGTAYASMNRIEIVPERGGAFQDPSHARSELVLSNNDGYFELDMGHARNFLDCVKSRDRPNCDVEEGHRSTSYALLANIALATRSRLEWDAQTERFTNNEAANALLDYEYRQPWSHV